MHTHTHLHQVSKLLIFFLLRIALLGASFGPGLLLAPSASGPSSSSQYIARCINNGNNNSGTAAAVAAASPSLSRVALVLSRLRGYLDGRHPLWWQGAAAAAAAESGAGALSALRAHVDQSLLPKVREGEREGS